MSRSCSQCGNNGHNTRTCGDGSAADGGCTSGGAAASSTGGENGIMLFGVRMMTEGSSFRKSVSMNNLSQYDMQPQDSNADVDAGYESDDVVHASGRSSERKRGVPWSEEEHRLFLSGLQKVGKGDWRGISRNFVKTRTPTQVASHAQKYFLRRTNQNRRRRRSSLFDITTDTFLGSTIKEDQVSPHQDTTATNLGVKVFPMSTFSVSFETSMQNNLPLGPSTNSKLSIPIPPSSKMADLNLNDQENPPSLPLSLKLSSPSSDEQPPTASTHSSSGAFKPMSSGDSIISVA
ncbi:transcription factor MYB1R1 [Mercurialis annua]|uniref:transcription factor MYB1R1 n=1 Tax=Mercurialis annua TaxID=3986 RepID=UPI00215EC716|nr:transcription factor MYB1R1 [Mercurialis annua]